MKEIILKAQKRTIFGKQVKKLRKEKQIPAILYGHKVENIPLITSLLDFKKIFKQAGESTILDLEIEGEKDPRKILVQDVQFDSLTGEILHADFHQINLEEELETEIPFKFIGESLAVKEKGGVLIKNLTEIKIKCLPKDLLSEIEVDISCLKDLHQNISIKDLGLSSRIKILEKEDETIVTVIPPRIEEEVKKEEVKVEEKVEKKVEEKNKED